MQLYVNTNIKFMHIQYVITHDPNNLLYLHELLRDFSRWYMYSTCRVAAPIKVWVIDNLIGHVWAVRDVTCMIFMCIAFLVMVYISKILYFLTLGENFIPIYIKSYVKHTLFYLSPQVNYILISFNSHKSYFIYSMY
jgi:hypothetical protein